MSTSVSTTQLNLRIISIGVFTCICYLSIGLPLAVLPGYIHYQLGYSTFVAGIVISLQYISTLISRPHAGRYTDIWGPKKVVSLGIICCLLSGAFTLLAVLLQATPMLAIAALLAGRVFLGVGESFTATGATLWGIKTVGAIMAWGWPLVPLASALSPPSSPSILRRTAGRARRLPSPCSASALSASAWCWEIPLPAMAGSRSRWSAL